MAYESSIPKAKENIKRNISTGMDAVSKKVLDDVKDNILRQGAKDTGQLLNSYKIVQTEDGFEIGSDLDYSLYVEFGTGVYAEDGKGISTPWAYKAADGTWRTTKGMRPRPHIRPAFENNAEEIEMMLAKELEDIE
jgi:HK97 gp10 family phage protein